MPSERDRHIHAQAPLRPLFRAVDRFVGRDDLREDPQRALEVLRAVRRKRDAARSAMEKPHAEVAFQFRDLRAHDRARQLERIGRLRERLSSGDSREGAHAGELVHRRVLPNDCPGMPNNDFGIGLFFRNSCQPTLAAGPMSRVR